MDKKEKIESKQEPIEQSGSFPLQSGVIPVNCFIYARSYGEACEYVNNRLPFRKDGRTYDYLSLPEKLMGLNSVEIIRIGEWWLRGDEDKINEDKINNEIIRLKAIRPLVIDRQG